MKQMARVDVSLIVQALPKDEADHLLTGQFYNICYSKCIAITCFKLSWLPNYSANQQINWLGMRGHVSSCLHSYSGWHDKTMTNKEMILSMYNVKSYHISTRSWVVAVRFISNWRHTSPKDTNFVTLQPWVCILRKTISELEWDH